MDLYVMRHGQTNYNLLGMCNEDPTKDVHLTEQGIKQAESVADNFAKTPLSRIYVSQLPRTTQTAEIINQQHNVPIITSASLNDIRTGFDGLPVADYFAAVQHDRYNGSPPGGESVKEFQQRVTCFIEELREIKERAVLVVTHEEALRVFAAHFSKLDPQTMMGLSFGNCEVLAFSV